MNLPFRRWNPNSFALPFSTVSRRSCSNLEWSFAWHDGCARHEPTHIAAPQQSLLRRGEINRNYTLEGPNAPPVFDWILWWISNLLKSVLEPETSWNVLDSWKNVRKHCDIEDIDSTSIRHPKPSHSNHWRTSALSWGLMPAAGNGSSVSSVQAGNVCNCSDWFVIGVWILKSVTNWCKSAVESSVCHSPPLFQSFRSLFQSFRLNVHRRLSYTAGSSALKYLIIGKH